MPNYDWQQNHFPSQMYTNVCLRTKVFDFHHWSPNEVHQNSMEKARKNIMNVLWKIKYYESINASKVDNKFWVVTWGNTEYCTLKVYLIILTKKNIKTFSMENFSDFWEKQMPI